MMTVVMDRTLLAPRPAPPAPRTPDRATLPYRRIVYGVLVGALTMFAVATLDTFAGATVPVLGTIAALPGPAGPAAVVEVPAPPLADPALDAIAQAALVKDPARRLATAGELADRLRALYA